MALTGMRFPINALGVIIYFAQRHARVAGNTRTIVVLRREVGRVAVRPAEFATHGPPRRVDRVWFAMQLVPLGRVTSHAERRRLPEEDRFQGWQVRLGRQHAEQDAWAILLHLDRR